MCAFEGKERKLKPDAFCLKMCVCRRPLHKLIIETKIPSVYPSQIVAKSVIIAIWKIQNFELKHIVDFHIHFEKVTVYLIDFSAKIFPNVSFSECLR